MSYTEDDVSKPPLPEDPPGGAMPPLPSDEAAPTPALPPPIDREQLASDFHDLLAEKGVRVELGRCPVYKFRILFCRMLRLNPGIASNCRDALPGLPAVISHIGVSSKLLCRPLQWGPASWLP